MKGMTASEYIYMLIAQGEHQQQDFKFEISDARKIAKSLSAFANTDGGRLLIGVKDNGKIAGVRSEEEEYMIQAAAGMYCRPVVEYSVTTYAVDGHSVLVVDIPRSESRPVMAKGDDGRYTAYVRVADENIVATAVHIRMWHQLSNVDSRPTVFTGSERLLLDTLGQSPCLTLNQCCRQTGLRRATVIDLLASFIRYDIVECTFSERRFVFGLKQ